MSKAGSLPVLKGRWTVRESWKKKDGVTCNGTVGGVSSGNGSLTVSISAPRISTTAAKPKQQALQCSATGLPGLAPKVTGQSAKKKRMAQEGEES
jgi:hypothetical protein